jgi:DNA-directed RNA polymerase II subunit RPB2
VCVSEKAIIGQESLKCNFPYISNDRSTKNGFKCSVRSDHPGKIRSTSTLYIRVSGKKNYSHAIPNVTVTVPFIKFDIPMVVIFRLLQVRSVQDMYNYIIGTNASPEFSYALRSILCTDTSGTTDMEMDDLYDWVGSRGSSEKNVIKRQKYAMHIFANEFLPHCQNQLYKAFYLGYCIRKLLRVYLGEQVPDDINSYCNKRQSVTGTLLSLLTRQLIRRHLKNIQMQIFRNDKGKMISDFFNHNSITSGLKYAMSTGNWGIQKGNGNNQSGVCQAVSLMNRSSRLASLRSFSTPLNRDGKMPEKRQLHMDNINCAAETPEGKSVGLTGTHSFLLQIRVECPTYMIVDLLHQDFDVRSLHDVVRLNMNTSTMFLVIVNGVPCGFTPNALELLEKYRLYRRWHSAPQNSNIYYDPESGEISINSDQDDCYRPVFDMKHFDKIKPVFQVYGDYPHLFWERLMIEGVIQYINKLEEKMLVVSYSYEDYLSRPTQVTHMEIHACFMLFGCSAGVIPFGNLNQAPRDIYQSAMGKQALSVKPLDFHYRLDNKRYALIYAQRPLVQTWIGQLSGDNDEPAGQPVVTAIQICTGYNQEDSSIISKQAIENGLFQTAVYRTYKDSEANHGADSERFGRIDDPDVTGKLKGDYSKVGDNGFCKVGQKVVPGDIIIQKSIEYTSTMKTKSEDFKSERKIRDRSISIKTNEPAIVEQVITHNIKDDLTSVAIRTVSHRMPQIGDKFSSRHGQKGVVGAIMAPEDMPFTASGLKVEIMISDHSFPSRMTIGHVREMWLGKAACLEGKIADGTPFRGKSDVEIAKILKNNGLPGFGKEVVYDGKTGKPLKNRVFIGICYYQRLRFFFRVCVCVLFSFSLGTWFAIKVMPDQQDRFNIALDNLLKVDHGMEVYALERWKEIASFHMELLQLLSTDCSPILMVMIPLSVRNVGLWVSRQQLKMKDRHYIEGHIADIADLMIMCGMSNCHMP